VERRQGAGPASTRRQSAASHHVFQPLDIGGEKGSDRIALGQAKKDGWTVAEHRLPLLVAKARPSSARAANPAIPALLAEPEAGGRASRMSDLEKPSLQVGDVHADFHALARRRNLHRDKRAAAARKRMA
jgi:hypothetical protein